MRRTYLALALLLGLHGAAYAQSSPGLIFGQVPTAAQWNSFFTVKQDLIGYTPLNKAGDSMLGLLTIPASTTVTAGFHLTPGAAPTTPNTGDMWTTASGLFVYLSGSTQQIITTNAAAQSVSQYYLNTSTGPTLTSCGAATAVAVGSSNQGGNFTLGTGSPSSCIVTFTNAYPNYAFCALTLTSNYSGTYYISAQDKTGFTATLGTPTSNVSFNYVCQGN